MTISFRIASDFHWEFYSGELHNSIDTETFLPIEPNEENTILLLSGDLVTVGTCWNLCRFFDDLSKRFKRIYTIMGNHEHYHNNFNSTYKDLRSFYSQWENITMLENDMIDFGNGVGLYGCTLWTGMNNGNVSTMEFAKYRMNDYRVIKYSHSDDKNPFISLTPHLTRDKHKESLQTMSTFLNRDFKHKIVMTHHSPSFRSVAPQFEGSELNHAFATDLDSLIEKSSVDLWIHGHMHNNSDYMIGNTRILCNPYGYRKENNNYIPNLNVYF